MKDHYIPQGQFPLEVCPGIRVLGNYFFNLILVSGTQKSALFEVGISGVVDQVIEQLNFLGVELDYIIPSHPHSDHMTGLPGLADRFPMAQIIVSKGAQEFVNHPKAGPALIKEDAFMSQGLIKMGITPGRPTLDHIPDLDQAQVISTETHLDLGGGTILNLIPVQGHSPGNLIAHVPGDQAVFCSDSLGFHYPGRAFWPLFFTNARAYVDTIDLIASLEPRIICPAHQGPILGSAVQNGLKTARQTTLDIIQRIKQTQLIDDQLIRELFEESYVDEFTLYTESNIKNCTRLLLKRAREE